MQAVLHMQNRFYKDFPPLPEEVGGQEEEGGQLLLQVAHIRQQH
jgi:hypothetical protein